MDDQKQKREELLKEITWSVFSAFSILVIFSGLIVLLKLTLKISFSPWIALYILCWILGLFIFLNVVKKQKEISVIHKIHFWHFVFELLMLTMIIHYAGGVEWFGAIFYTFFIVYGVFLLPRKLASVMVLTAILFFSGIVILEYIGAIPHHDFFNGENLYQNFGYICNTLLFAAGVFILLYLVANRFAKKIRSQNTELEKKARELKKEKELAERFNKLAVGRELKMMELKERIKRLEKNK